jgi:acetylornithine deacetylase
MRAIAPESSIRFEHVGGIPAFAVDATSPLTVDVKRLLGVGCETKVVDFGTEAGLYQNAGIPTVVCGPGSIAEAHKANEFITLEQLARCELFLQSLIRERD